MAKSADAFRTISEVAEWLDTPAHVLRFWESRFTQIKPVKRAGGRRYYRPTDMLLLGGIKKLLHDDGITIKAAQTILREQGIKHTQSLSQPVAVQVSIKKKTAAKEIETPVATPESIPTPKPEMAKQMDLLDDTPTENADQTPQTLQPDVIDKTASNAELFVSKMPEALKVVQNISATDLQDIEALYFSLKMVRNNMQRTTAGA